MKARRCDSCGRVGARMVPIYNRWVKRIDGYRCASVAACNERVRHLGQWVGVRSPRRRDLDGTEYWICPCNDGVQLTITYREHRLSSVHPTRDAAKAHVEDLLASWKARSLQDYAKGRS